VDFAALVVTLKLASTTAVVLLLIGAPAAWWIATTRSRFKLVVESVIALPIVLPPTVLGFYLLTACGPHGALGRAATALGGAPLAFTFEGILLASLLFNLPFAVGPYAAAFAGVDRRLLESARCLGASGAGAFVRVALPLARPGLMAGTLLVFAHALGEFGVVLMVGGSVPGVTRTLSIDVYERVQALDYESAGKTSGALLIASFLLLLSVRALERRRAR
jgi:molybdate transport system permease protein